MGPVTRRSGTPRRCDYNSELSSHVFEGRTSTGSERFSLFKCLDTTKSVLLSVFTLTETICPNICSKSRLKSAKSPLPVDVRRSKTLLLKLPNLSFYMIGGVTRHMLPHLSGVPHLHVNRPLLLSSLLSFRVDRSEDREYACVRRLGEIGLK